MICTTRLTGTTSVVLVQQGTSTATGTVAITGTGNGTGTIHIGFFNDIIMITLASNNCFCQIYLSSASSCYGALIIQSQSSIALLMV